MLTKSMAKKMFLSEYAIGKNSNSKFQSPNLYPGWMKKFYGLSDSHH
ncbi:MAG: hypothetical protein ACI8RO_000030 [Flavobacteriales bacterium]|jgi:hypothetical protein